MKLIKNWRQVYQYLFPTKKHSGKSQPNQPKLHSVPKDSPVLSSDETKSFLRPNTVLVTDVQSASTVEGHSVRAWQPKAGAAMLGGALELQEKHPHWATYPSARLGPPAEFIGNREALFVLKFKWNALQPHCNERSAIGQKAGRKLLGTSVF